MRHDQAAVRRAALTVEAAFVHPVLLLLLLGIVVGGVGVFRYQQVACLAREAARHASVRGSNWQAETELPSPTEQQLRDNIVLPASAGMAPGDLTVSVEWVDRGTGAVVAWDQASKEPTSRTAGGDAVANRVRVTVTYRWLPPVLLTGPFDLRSVAEMPMSF